MSGRYGWLGLLALLVLAPAGAQDDVPATADALYRQANAFYEEYTWDRAIELFERFVERYPGDPRVTEVRYKTLKAKLEWGRAGDLTEPLQAFIDAHANTVWEARGERLLARWLTQTSRWENWARIGSLYEQAIRDFRSAIGRRPMTDGEQRELVDLMFEAVDFYTDWYEERAHEVAEKHLRTIIQYNVDDEITAQAWFRLAQLYLGRMDKPEEADQVLLNLVHEFPKTEVADQALYVLANRTEQQGDYVLARARYQELRKRYPQSPFEDDAAERIADIEQPRLDLRISQTHLPGAKIPTRVQTRNIDGVVFTAWRLDPDKLLAQLGKLVDGRMLLHDEAARPALLNQLGTQVETWRQPVDDQGKYEWHQLRLDTPLRDAGLYFIEAKAVGADISETALVNLTSLVLVQNYAADKLVSYVADRLDHKPVPNVKLHVRRPTDDEKLAAVADGTTNADGLHVASLQPGAPANRLWTVGRRGNELVFIDDLYAYWSPPGRDTRVYLYTDRPVYRPENTVHYRAILRSEFEGDFENLPGKTVQVTIRDPRGEEIKKETLTTDEYGTLSGSVELTENPTLGVYNVQLAIGEDGIGGGQFRVEEYRKPEFKVEIGDPLAEVRPDGAAAVPIDATYYFGAPVANAEVNYVVQRRPYYHWYWWPRGPWDWFYSSWDDDRHGYWGSEVVTEGTVRTDEQGRAVIEFPTAPGRDYTYTIQAEVVDVTRRVVEASDSLTVTQRGFFLNARTNQNLYRPGSDVTATVQAETADGLPVERPVTVSLYRMVWVDEKKNEKTGDIVAAHWERGEKLWEQRLTTDPATGEEDLIFDAPADGHYRLEFTAPDTFDPQATVSTTTDFWTADDAWKGRNYDYTELNLVTEQDLYEVGQTARILLNSPVPDGAALVTIGAQQIYDAKVVRLNSSNTVIEVPILDTYAPNVFLQAQVVGTSQVYFAQTEIQVPPTRELLNVKVSSDQEEYKPRTSGTFVIETTDRDGKPVPAQVSLGITDESVYAIQEEMVQPIAVAFYGGRRYDGIRQAVSFESWGEYDEEFAEQAADNVRRSAPADGAAPPAPMMAKGGREVAAEPMAAATTGAPGGQALDAESITVREFFPDTILWQPAVVTGADGRAEVTVEFPDSLTTWRATARAITQDTEVGQEVDRVVTSKDLLVRLQAPRFFTQMDRSTISLIVTNRTSQQQQVAVGLDIEGLELVGEGRDQVMVEPNGQVRVDREVVATDPGVATITALARGPEDSDGLKLSFDVLPHGAEKFQVEAGRVGENGAASFALDLPAQRRDDATALTLTVNPTLVSTLMDALPYLAQYPYGCVEQTTSRFIPAVLVARVVGYTGAVPAGQRPPNAPEGWEARGLAELPDMVRTGIARLVGMQNPDGGFGWFSGMRSDLYMTAYVVYGLTQARLADYAVPAEVYSNAVDFLYANLHLLKEQTDSSAYVAWVLSETLAEQMHEPTDKQRTALNEAVDRVYAARQDLNDYTRALLILATDNLGRGEQAQVVWRNLQANRIETEHGVHWGESRWGWRWSEDQVETTAFTLMAALEVEPDSPLVDKAMQWLVLNRTGSHWYSTKDTATAIYALVRYAEANDELSARYTATVQVNGQTVQTLEVTPENVLSLDTKVAVDPALLKTGENQVTVTRDGNGSLYYSALLVYYTMEEPITAASSYIAAERTYYRVTEYTDPEDNVRKTRRVPLGDGEPIASGEQIEVEIAIESENDFSYVCFTDPKPAGCEPVDQTSGGTWGGTWAYRELHDESVTFFVDHLDQGTTKLSYRLRAETPGVFHALPHNGFAMYRADVRCLSNEALIRVTEREDSEA